MSGSRTTVAWDSCVILSWLLGDRSDHEMNGIEEYITRIEDGKLVLVVSILVDAEVLDSSLSDETRRRLEGFQRRSNVHRATPDPRIMELSGELRDYYRREKHAGNIDNMLGTPDSIHLATAIHYDVDEFHTFDDGGKGNSLSLLSLNGNVAGHRLTICRPIPDQTRLRGF